MDLPILIQVFIKHGLYLLTLIISACLGHDCSSDPSIITNLRDASILQGQNHTFECEGTGPTPITWSLNGTTIFDWPHDSKLELVAINHTHSHAGNACIQGSKMTVLAKGAPEDNTSSTFLVGCGIDRYPIQVFSKAYLKVHVIGEAGDVQLIPPANPQGSAVIQWQAPNVLSGSSSPLYYNITVMSFMQAIAQATTSNTFFAIDSDQLVPCASYQLTVLPFQQISGHTELGIITQTSMNYSGIPLPAHGVDLSISVQPNSAQVTIHFQAQLTSCSLRQAKKFTVTVNQKETDADEAILSVQQTVMGIVNEYTLEKMLDLRQKYQLSIILENDFSSSAPEIANFSTYNVQNVTLKVQEDRCELNVQCVMAKGVEDEGCTVEMTNETGAMQRNCIPTNGTNTTCKLAGLPPGKYMVLGYDWEYKEIAAVKLGFLFTKEIIEDPTNTVITSREMDNVFTTQAIPSNVHVGGSSTIIIMSASAAVLVGLLVLTVIFLILLVCYEHRRKSQSAVALENPASGTVTYRYERDQRNEREPTPPPPIPTSRPPPIHRNPAYLSVTPKRTVPTRPLPNHATYEIVGHRNPAYQHVTPNPNLPSTPSAAT